MPADLPGPLPILPPLVAIGLALATRRVVPSLLAGIGVGGVLLAGGHPLHGLAVAIDTLIGVLGDAGQTRVVVFTLLMGSLLEGMRRDGGVAGFVAWAGRWAWARSRRGAQLAAAGLGLGVFVESNITCLVVGAVSRPIFDRLGLSRARLAYLCDATSAPVCMLIPLNGWGAMVLGLLVTEAAAGHLGSATPFHVFVQAIPFNLYSLAAVALVFVAVLTGFSIGPLRRSDAEARAGAASDVPPAATAGEAAPRAGRLLLPLTALLVAVPVGILATGRAGVRAAGMSDPGWMDLLGAASGSTAVLWGVLAALAVGGLLALTGGRAAGAGWAEGARAGAAGMLPMALLMVLAFGLGSICAQLGTGRWLAGVAMPWLAPRFLPVGVFLLAAAMAFATGTSWGTFAVVMPLAVPLAHGLGTGDGGILTPLVVGAVLGGGVFGDHCSPISDTTLISSLAAGCDHHEHVRTQLPFALLGGAVAAAGYLALGLIA